jgi:hypothetical protein
MEEPVCFVIFLGGAVSGWIIRVNKSQKKIGGFGVGSEEDFENSFQKCLQ